VITLDQARVKVNIMPLPEINGSVIYYNEWIFVRQEGQWILEEEANADQLLFDQQLISYCEAVSRLEQYQVAIGQDAVCAMRYTGQQQYNEETQLFEDIEEEVEVRAAIPPVNPTVLTINDDGEEVEIENPLITQDNTERAAAQEVIDNTPEEVIDHYNAHHYSRNSYR